MQRVLTPDGCRVCLWVCLMILAWKKMNLCRGCLFHPDFKAQISSKGVTQVKNKGQRFHVMGSSIACAGLSDCHRRWMPSIQEEERAQISLIKWWKSQRGQEPSGLGAIQPTERHVSKAAAAETDKRGQSKEVPLCSASCQQAAHTPSSISSLHCSDKWLSWLLERNMVPARASVCPKRAALLSFVWISVCLSSYRLFVITITYRTKPPVTFISTLVLLWCVLATDSLYQHMHASIAWPSFFHLSTSPPLLLFGFSSFCPYARSFSPNITFTLSTSSPKHLLRCFGIRSKPKNTKNSNHIYGPAKKINSSFVKHYLSACKFA